MKTPVTSITQSVYRQSLSMTLCGIYTCSGWTSTFGVLRGGHVGDRPYGNAKGASRNYGDCRRIKLQLCQIHIGIAGKRSATDKAGALSYGDKVDVSALP